MDDTPTINNEISDETLEEIITVDESSILTDNTNLNQEQQSIFVNSEIPIILAKESEQCLVVGTAVNTEENSEVCQNTDENYKLKTLDIEVELNNDVFPLEISNLRRRGKQKDLKNEEFDLSVYKNQAGFITERPVRWALAFEAYMKNNTDVRCRWQYKIDETSKKYRECEILLYFETTRHVTVKIHLITGTIIVTGVPFKDWIKAEFQKVQTEFTNQLEPDKGVKVADKPDETTEIDLLWEKQDEIINAIATQDESLNDLIKKHHSIEARLESQKVEMEKTFEGKLSVFKDSILTELRKEIQAVASDSVKRCTAVSAAVANLAISTQKTINDNQANRQSFEKDTKSKVDKLLKELGSIDLSGYTESLEFETNERKEENKKQQTEIEKAKETIASMEVKLNRPLSNPTQGAHDSPRDSSNLNLRIQELEKQIRLRDNEILSLRSILVVQEEKLRNNSKPTNNVTPPPPRQQNFEKETTNKKKAEIMMIFDSNGKNLDRKRLWKLQGSIFTRCGSIYEANKAIDETNIEELDYILLSVGCNDLDLKDHMQVFGELEVTIDKLRKKFPGIKIIISEITPRKDRRDAEVIKCNTLIWQYVKSHHDLFIILHNNLRDPTWSMYTDDKHIHSEKMGRYAGNIIRGLKQAYQIKDKRDLFVEKKGRDPNEVHHSHEEHSYQQYTSDSFFKNHMSQRRGSINNKLREMANYDQPFKEEIMSDKQKELVMKKLFALLSG